MSDVQGTITSLVYQPHPTEQTPPYAYVRVPTERITLIAGHGIEGDQKAGHNPKRHLNIMSQEIVDQLGREGFKASPGQLGEQVIVSGLDVNALEQGTRLQLGDSAVVVINTPRTGCSWFEQIQEKSPTLAQGRLGVMATVVESGVLAVGDAVRVLETVAAVSA